MRNKKIWTKTLAALLCAVMLFPMSAFATEAEQGGQPEVQAEEQTEQGSVAVPKTEEEISVSTEDSNNEAAVTPDTAGTETPDNTAQEGDGSTAEEADVLPTIGKVTATFGGTDATWAPITAGSGKYKASTIEMEMADADTGLLMVGVGQNDLITDEMLTDGVPVYAMFEEGEKAKTSGKAGLYDIRVTFRNEAGEVVHTDEDSVKVYVEEDWSIASVKENNLKWDGVSDLVFKFDPGYGLGAIGYWIWDVDTLEVYGHNVGPLCTLSAGTDYEIDLIKGTITIKGSALKRIASEDETFGDDEYYYFDMLGELKSETQPVYFSWRFSYDRNAAQQEPGNTPEEVTLTEGKTALPADEMAALVERNQQSDVVIHTPNGVDFTFAKGTMKLIDGKESYDFGSTLITGFEDSGISGVSKEEFAFRINFNYAGELPGNAKISISLGKDSPWIGKTLYYALTEAGRLTKQIDENVVDENGVYTVEQNHCSDYVATTKNLAADKTAGQDTLQGKQSPKTGDSTAVFLFAVLVLVSGAAAFAAIGAKKRLR